jgi:ubiquinone/menaquinone biosynthesis C-methylase UbiE
LRRSTGLGPAAGLDQGLPALRLVQATLACGALALTFAAVAFAVGTATGSRPVALGTAAALAVAGFLVEDSPNSSARCARSGPPAPGTSLLGTDPLQHGLAWQAWALPLGSAYCWSWSAPPASPAATSADQPPRAAAPAGQATARPAASGAHAGIKALAGPSRGSIRPGCAGKPGRRVRMPCERLEAAMGVPGVTVASFDASAGHYDHSQLQPALYLPVHRSALRLARRLLPRPRRILDVGCGTGRLLRQARQQYPRAELVGVDPAWQMLAIASTQGASEPKLRYVHAAAERLPFACNTFDLAFATLSLRHWTDQDAGIAQLARALTPGGVLVVADVFPTCRHRGRVAWLWWRRRFPVPDGLAPALATHRLAVVAQDRTPWFALPDVQVVAAQKPTAQRRRPPGSPSIAWRVAR